MSASASRNWARGGQPPEMIAGPKTILLGGTLADLEECLMTDVVEYPDIRHVVPPVHLDGTLTGARPRMRHNPGCGHFKWPDGTVLGTPERTDADSPSMQELH